MPHLPKKFPWVRPGTDGWLTFAENPLVDAPRDAAAAEPAPWDGGLERELSKVFNAPIVPPDPTAVPDLDSMLSKELEKLGVPAPRSGPLQRGGWRLIYAGPIATEAERRRRQLAVLEAERAQLVAEVEALRGVA